VTLVRFAKAKRRRPVQLAFKLTEEGVMIDPPAPERRSQNDERQRFYKAGWRQRAYDHDSFALLDRIEHAVDDEPDDARRCELRAVMREGARDALSSSPTAHHEGAAFARALQGGDAA
jgi:hypothetical protein